jgi:uncharacterized protein YxjI
MNYPLNLSFKVVALAPQIFLTDAQGGPICYVKQKMFKLKEAVHVFTDSTKSTELCSIEADRVIDFSACYKFTDASGNEFGSVKRKGLRSIFKANYEIADNGVTQAEINEDNGWVKVMDSLFTGIPIVGMFAGYVFHPSYTVTRMDGTPIMQLKKQAAFFEGKFTIEKLAEMDETEEMRAFMAILMMTLLERSRG